MTEVLHEIPGGFIELYDAEGALISRRYVHPTREQLQEMQAFYEAHVARLTEALREAYDTIKHLADCSECAEAPYPREPDSEWSYCRCKNFGILTKFLREPKVDPEGGV